MIFSHQLLAVLLVGGSGATDVPSRLTRAELISGFRLIIEENDKNGDAKLSVSEIKSMIDLETRMGFESEYKVRQWRINDLARQDLDKDGNLDFYEFTKEVLANFDCADVDRDGYITQSESLSTFERCPLSHVEVDIERPIWMKIAD